MTMVKEFTCKECGEASNSEESLMSYDFELCERCWQGEVSASWFEHVLPLASPHK